MKYTFDRHRNIVEIEPEKMDAKDLELYLEFRPIWDTKEQAEKEIWNYKPIRVDTGTDKNDHYYI